MFEPHYQPDPRIPGMGLAFWRVDQPNTAVVPGVQLHPDDNEDPYAFRLDLSEYGVATVRVVFSRDQSWTTGFHLDGILLAAETYPRSINPRLWVVGAVGVLAAASTVMAIRRSPQSAKVLT
jgi:hypothetical protein